MQKVRDNMTSRRKIISAVARLLEKVADMPDNKVATDMVVKYIENAQIAVDNAIRMGGK